MVRQDVVDPLAFEGVDQVDRVAAGSAEHAAHAPRAQESCDELAGQHRGAPIGLVLVSWRASCGRYRDWQGRA